MNQITTLTTKETSLALIKAGMPVPDPAQGQVWYNEHGCTFLLYHISVSINVNVRRLRYCLIVSETGAFDRETATLEELTSKYTTAFSAPEIMGWASVDDRVDLSAFQNGMWGCNDFYSPNPAEAVASAVLKLIGDGK